MNAREKNQNRHGAQDSEQAVPREASSAETKQLPHARDG